jgi:hypothetical protein
MSEFVNNVVGRIDRASKVVDPVIAAFVMPFSRNLRTDWAHIMIGRAQDEGQVKVTEALATTLWPVRERTKLNEDLYLALLEYRVSQERKIV